MDRSTAPYARTPFKRSSSLCENRLALNPVRNAPAARRASTQPTPCDCPKPPDRACTSPGDTANGFELTGILSVTSPSFVPTNEGDTIRLGSIDIRTLRHFEAPLGSTLKPAGARKWRAVDNGRGFSVHSIGGDCSLFPSLSGHGPCNVSAGNPSSPVAAGSFSIAGCG